MKLQCDPSHRRSHNDMSRTSTSSSSSRMNPSPVASTPSAQSAQSASFNSTNTFDDFILFPDDVASWNPADMAMTDFASQDLSQFNFDINDLDMNAFAPITPDMDFNNTNAFASYSQQSYSSTNQSQSNSRIPSLSQPSFGIDSQLPGFAPLTSDQYGLDSWAEPQGYSTNGASHTRPHPASPLNSGQLDGSWNSDLLQGMADSPSSSFDLLQGGNDFSSNNTPSSSYSPLSSSQRLDSSWNTDILRNVGDSGIFVDPSDQVTLLVSDARSRIARQDSHANVNVQGTSVQSGSDLLQGDGDSGMLVDPSDQVARPSHDSSRTVDINRLNYFRRPQVLDGHALALSDTIDNINISRANAQSEQSAMPTALIQSPTRNRVPSTASEQLHTVNVPAYATQSAQEQAQGLGSFNFTEVQPGSNCTTTPFGDGSTNLPQVQAQAQSQRDPLFVHCLARQDQLLDSEPEQTSMLLPSSSTQVASTMSSMVLVVLSTLLLSGFAVLAVSGYFNVFQQWIGGTTESFGLVEMSRLAVCGIFVAFLPELFSGSSAQASGCFQSGFGMAFALLSFFSGSGLSDVCFPPTQPHPILSRQEADTIVVDIHKRKTITLESSLTPDKLGLRHHWEPKLLASDVGTSLSRSGCRVKDLVKKSVNAY